MRVGWEEAVERSIAENGCELLDDEWLDLPLYSNNDVVNLLKDAVRLFADAFSIERNQVKSDVVTIQKGLLGHGALTH